MVKVSANCYRARRGLILMTMEAAPGIVNPRQEQAFNGLPTRQCLGPRLQGMTIANYKINLVQLTFSLSPNSTTYLNSPNVFSQITNYKIELILFINSVPRRKIQQVKCHLYSAGFQLIISLQVECFPECSRTN